MEEVVIDERPGEAVEHRALQGGEVTGKCNRFFFLLGFGAEKCKQEK
jgi:hypothetical protein